MNSGIYTITNIVDGKMYVGYATVIEDRISHHKSELCAKKHKNDHLQKAWNKYGQGNFVFEELVKCEEEYLCSEEHYWCNLLDVHNRDRGYNIQPTHPHVKNKRHAQESIDKIKRKIKEDIAKPDYKDRRRLWSEKAVKTKAMNCLPVSDKTREKLSKANKGKVRTAEQREHLSKIRKGFKISEAGKKKQIERQRELRGKKILVEHTDGTKLEFGSIAEASEKLHISISYISNIVNDRCRQYKSFKLSYM